MKAQIQMYTLSQNGILYLSSGFDGPFFVQVIAAKATHFQNLYQSQDQSLKYEEYGYEHHLCLTDGKLYIGGRYRQKGNKLVQIPMYSILKIEGRFVSKWAPIQISSLEIVTKQCSYLLGRSPSTLHDYFANQKQSNTTCMNSVSERSQDSAQMVETLKATYPESLPKKRIRIANQFLMNQQTQPTHPTIETHTNHKVKQTIQKQIHKQMQTKLLQHKDTKPQPIIHKNKIIQNNQLQAMQLQQQNKKFNKQSQDQGQQSDEFRQQDIEAQIQTQIKARKNLIKTKNIEINSIDSSSQQIIMTTVKTQTQPITKAKPIIQNQSQIQTQIQPNTQIQCVNNSNTTTTPLKVYKASQHQIFINSQLIKNSQTHNVYISDLYERMLRWKILTRVISLRTFISTRGKKCTLMHIIDQKGDDIKAIYYYNKSKNNPGEILAEGKIYSISGGTIVKPQDTTNPSSSSELKLQIILDYNCQIQQYTQIFIYPFSNKKNIRFQQLLHFRGQVNVIGIVKNIQVITQMQNSYRNKTRVKATLCNPVQMYQIQFSKGILEGQNQIIQGEMYVLYYFIVMEVENAIRLIGNGNSFLLRIHEQDILYNKAPNYIQSKQLKKIKQTAQNSKLSYLNLSQIKYSKRTISQLKLISSETQNTIYSELLISIADIKLKKQYKACPICKHSTIQQQHTLYQCLKCKKIVDPTPNIIVKVTLADTTGSLDVDIFGQHVRTIIGIQIGQFVELSSEQKECNLQIAKYSQFVVKIKTQKKSFKQLTHILQEIQKQQHTETMNQIRRRTVDQKLKLQSNWQILQ